MKKKITKSQLSDAITQALAKVLYMNKHGVCCDASWQMYSIFIMTGREDDLLEMFKQIDIQYMRLVEQNEKERELQS